MTRKEYRKRRLVNKYAKQNKVSVSKAILILDAQERIGTTLGRLKPSQRLKVLKAVCILLDHELIIEGRP